MKFAKTIMSISVLLILMLAPLQSSFAEEWTSATTEDPTKSWIVQFNTTLDEKTVNNNNIFIYDGNCKKHPTEVTLLEDRKGVTIKPKEKYVSDTTYSLHITTGVHAQSGKAIQEKVSMAFKLGIEKERIEGSKNETDSCNGTETSHKLKVDLEKSSVLTKEENFVYIPLNERPKFVDIELEGPPGYTQAGSSVDLQDLPESNYNETRLVPYHFEIFYDQPAGTWIVKNIKVTYRDGSIKEFPYGENHRLEFEVSQKDVGVPVHVDIPFASDDVMIQDIIFNKPADENNPTETLSTNNGQHIPENTYNIQIKATDGSNSYILFKRGYDFNNDTNDITFTKSETSHLSINMNNPDLQVNGLTLSPKNWKTYSMTPLYNDSDSVYVSKMEYKSLKSSFQTGDQFELDYQTFDINAENDVTVEYDTDLFAELNFKDNPPYYGYKENNNLRINDESLQLRDGFNNAILFATDADYNHVNGSLLFKDGTETLNLPIDRSLAIPEITLPSKGDYEVTYKNEGIPFPVDSNQANITIE